MGDKHESANRLVRVLNYNRHRIDRALSLFNDKQRPLFFVMPFLLQVNHPDLPGFIDNPDVPYGLALYSYQKEDKEAMKTVFPEHHSLLEDPKVLWPKLSYVESLSLMGSIGTIAQSEKSDLDYWVCVNPGAVKGDKWTLLQQKLTLIEDWAWQTHQLEVHFFLSDIEKVRNNDFGAADGESAGSAQPMFLKNEYYSTNIVISGKIPFWWIAPCNCTDETYQQAYYALKNGSDPNPNDFIDLGNIEKFDASEMFGAAIWQLTKAMDSPFKSVLKMAKLEVFCDNTDQQTPLCNILKGMIHKGVDMESDVRITDPYTLMFDSIITYYRVKNPKFIELFQACLYIKSGCAFTRTKHVHGKNFKRDVVVDYLKSWNWDRDTVENYDQIKHWEFSQVNILGKQIHSFLIGCYRRISAKIQGREQLVSDEDMTVIGRKISSFYGTKKGKVQYLKRAFETGLLQDELTITMELDLQFDTKQRWCAFRGRQHYQDTKDDNNRCFLKDSSDPVDLILWCIFNRIADFDSAFHLLQSHLPISALDIKELMEEAFIDCQPIRISELPAEQLLDNNQVSHCLLVVNFSSQSSEQDIETVRVIYLTTWGELYSFGNIKAFKKNKTGFLAQALKPHCRLFTPSRNNRKVLYRLIEEQTAFTFDKVGVADAVVVPPLPEPEPPPDAA